MLRGRINEGLNYSFRCDRSPPVQRGFFDSQMDDFVEWSIMMKWICSQRMDGGFFDWTEVPMRQKHVDWDSISRVESYAVVE